jgi:acetyltransferase-like isoleucine patch superfamily enzyme
VRVDVGDRETLVTVRNVWLAPDVEVQTGSQVSIGDGTTIQRRSSVGGDARIGCGCILAPNVFVSSGTHPFCAYPALPIRDQEARWRAMAGSLSWTSQSGSRMTAGLA